jgi:Ca-activated chloride channel family protein
MSSNKNETWNDPRITAYVLDEMSPDERTVFEKEMASDDALAQAVTGAGQVTGQLSALFEAESTPALASERRAAIIEKTVIIRPKDERNGRRAIIAFLAIAATALVCIGLAPLTNQRKAITVGQRNSGNNAGSKVTSIEDELKKKQPTGSIVLEVAESDTKVVSNLDSDNRAGDIVADNTAVPSARDPNQQSLEMNRSRVKRSRLGRRKPQTVMQDVQMPLGSLTDSFAMEALDSSPLPSRVAQHESGGLGGQYRGRRLAKPGNQSRSSGAMLGLRPRTMIGKEKGLARTGFGFANAEGRGPGMGGDQFDPIIENDFIRTADHPLSTFSVDVDTASYSKVRDFLMRANRLPRPDAVRIEEMINYFDYADEPPADDAEHPFAASVNIAECPWNEGHRLARIAIKGKTMKPKDRPACNLVFLLDTSGSMNATNKLPLVIDGMKMLTSQLTKNDTVAIVVYAGSAGLVLDSVPAKQKKKIRHALQNLSAGGSTNGGQGIALAYQTAREHFIEGGVNRVILCTDGDFNVGTTGTDSLVRMVEKKAKDNVYLTVLGFGMGNHNDAMLERISGRGNGNYAFIDNQREARKVLVQQTAGTLVTIAKDVKLQVDFNPAKVGAYRLIGYENRILAKEDFNDDKKDAGEIGAGHSVIALYELVPPELAGKLNKPAVEESKYAVKGLSDETEESTSDETLTVRIRYKRPDADTSNRVDYLATDDSLSFDDSSIDTRFTAAVAGFGMLLRGSQHSGDWELSDVLKVAQSSLGKDKSELRSEFVQLVEKAKQLRGE